MIIISPSCPPWPPELQSRRDALLKEKFWIEEDEPIAQEIVLSATSSSASSGTNPSQEPNAKDPKDSRDLRDGKDLRDEAMASTSTNALMLRAGHMQAQDGKGKKKRNRELLCQVRRGGGGKHGEGKEEFSMKISINSFSYMFSFL